MRLILESQVGPTTKLGLRATIKLKARLIIESEAGPIIKPKVGPIIKSKAGLADIKKLSIPIVIYHNY